MRFIYLAFGIQVRSRHTAIIRCWRRLCQRFGPRSTQRPVRFRWGKTAVRNESREETLTHPYSRTACGNSIPDFLEEFCFKVCTSQTLSADKITSHRGATHPWDTSVSTCPKKMLMFASRLASLSRQQTNVSVLF